MGTQLLYFWAEWCVPCRSYGPLLARVAGELGLPIVKVNADEEEDLVVEFKVMSLPTVIVMKEGRQVAILAGAMTEAQLITALTAVQNA